MALPKNRTEAVEELRVAANTDAKKTASCIAKSCEEGKIVEISTIGAGALNQCQKAIIIASSHLASKGITIYEKTFFKVVKINDEDKTAIGKRLIFSRD